MMVPKRQRIVTLCIIGLVLIAATVGLVMWLNIPQEPPGPKPFIVID